MTDQIPNRLWRKVGQVGLAIVAALAVVVGVASPAYANFPHFQSSSVTLTSSTLATAGSATSSGSALVQLPNVLFSWTEVGLGTPDVTYKLSTLVTVTFGCVNGGAKHPSASNKTIVAVPNETTVDLKADKNGRITGSVVLVIPAVSSGDFSCPSGQTLVALLATFTQNTITDTTNHVPATDEDISVTLWP
jgi:hypothetical protein